MSTIATFGNNWVGFGSAGSIVGAPVVQPVPSLPAKTLRCEFYDSFDPTTDMPDCSEFGMTWTHVSGNIYDFNCTSTYWTLDRGPNGAPGSIFNAYGVKTSGVWTFPMTQHEFDIIDSNLTGVTNIRYLLAGAWRCRNAVMKNLESVTVAGYAFAHGQRNMYLESINDLNMPALTDASSMFTKAVNLTALPFVTAPLLTLAYRMYSECRNAASGIYDMYEYLSTKSVAVTSYSKCFEYCGSQSVSGAQELAQIPQSWGGTGA